MIHRIVITPSRDSNKAPRHNRRGTLFDATYEGRVIVTRSTEPCLAACRALKEMGLSGRLEMWDTVLPYVRLTADISTSATKTIREGDEVPRLVEYTPFAPRSALDGDLAFSGVGVAKAVKNRPTDSPGAPASRILPGSNI